ncbi:MAG: hypothetical protein CMJ78_15810 [Planctomycetaceae bacterium]|nr:hypothetical protein [Planctomycetaceae bacterium]
MSEKNIGFMSRIAQSIAGTLRFADAWRRSRRAGLFWQSFLALAILVTLSGVVATGFAVRASEISKRYRAAADSALDRNDLKSA